MFTMAPAFDSRSAGKSAFVSRIAAKRLRAKLACHSSSGMDAVPCGNPLAPPALFTRMSRPPRASSAPAAMAFTPEAEATSPATNAAPAGKVSPRERAVTTTFAPASSRRCAIAAPMPRVPPVTSARRPMSSLEKSSLLDMRFLSSRAMIGARLTAGVEISDHDSSVELDQVLKDQATPAISARLHKQSTLRKAAKFDRRETEIFRKRTNLRCGTVIVARQEHDSPAPMYGRILVKDGSDQMVEALDQCCASEGVRDELGRRLSSQFLRGHAVGIGHIDDRLPLPGAQRLCDIRVGFEADRQKDDVRLDRFRQCFGDDRGSDRGRIGCKAFRVARGCHGHFDALAGKRLGKSVADLTEADNCVAHIVSLGLARPTGSEYRMGRRAGRSVARQSCARPPSTATSLAVMKLLSDDARKAAAAPTSAGSPMRWSAVIEP